jgi:LDH2 family malate/lactate/ureidoglycolate dehydrogenase
MPASGLFAPSGISGDPHGLAAADDNALCGYRFAGLPRILAIAREAKTRNVRVPVAIVHETPTVALVDGGNNVGYVAVYRGAEIAIAKAKQNGIAAVGVYNSYFSGRNAYYLERIVNAGLVGGYGLAFAIQALGLLAGAAIPRCQVQDYGFLFLVVDPGVMLPGNPFAEQMSQLAKAIQATPRRPGVAEIRIPSQRAFRERERRRVEGILVDRAVMAALEAL